MSSLFSFLNQRPRLAASATVVLIIICVAVVYANQRQSNSAPQGDIYFDESNGTLTRRPSTEIPALRGASGAESLVRAVTSDESMKPESVHYLFRFTAEAKQRLSLAVATNPKGTYTNIFLEENEGKEVRRFAEGSPWVSATSKEGQAIIEGATAQ